MAAKPSFRFPGMCSATNSRKAPQMKAVGTHRVVSHACRVARRPWAPGLVPAAASAWKVEEANNRQVGEKLTCSVVPTGRVTVPMGEVTAVTVAGIRMIPPAEECTCEA